MNETAAEQSAVDAIESFVLAFIRDAKDFGIEAARTAYRNALEEAPNETGVAS